MMGKRTLGGALGLILFLGWVGAGSAEDSKVSITGFVDTYYSYNFNNPDSRFNKLHNFHFNDRQFSLSLAEVAFQKAPEPAGFRVDLDFGPTTDWVHSTEPTVPAGGTPKGMEVYKNIQQAYVSYKAANGVTFDMGKFVTHMGYEVIESKDNPNYSRSLLFAWAIPYYHAGFRANVPLGDKLYVNGYVYNGWNDVQDENNSLTLGAQVGFTPAKNLSIIQNWIGGKEGVAEDRRDVLDTVVNINLADNLLLGLNLDYGRAANGVSAGNDATYKGLAALLKVSLSDRLAVTPRYEWFDDADSFATGSATTLPLGTSVTLQEATLTGEYKFDKAMLTRLEYRRDWADVNVFDKEAGTNNVDSEQMVTLGVVYAF